MIKQRAFCDMRPSMLKNPLLVRNKIGHAAPSTHDLPGEDYRYGKTYKKGLGVKENFENYARIETAPVSTRRRGTDFTPTQDFIATNRAAIRHGCRTAKEFRDYQQSHPIMKKAEVSDAGIESKEAFHKRVTNMVHGISTPVSSEMKDCLTWKFGRDAKAKALARREYEMTSTKHQIKNAKKTTLQRAARATRASRGHTVVPYKPPKESEVFKIKRFAEIDHYAIDDKWD